MELTITGLNERTRCAPTASLGAVLIREEVLALAKKQDAFWDVRLVGE
jgi:hypothetical protein